jgi:plastocyanin
MRIEVFPIDPGGIQMAGVGSRTKLVRLMAALVAVFVMAAAPGLVRSVSAQSTVNVSIENFSFSPASISVSAGDTVVWTNNDSVAHTVTSTDGAFDTGDIAPGASASVTFDNAGTFAYICSIHPSMTGSVDVAAVDNGGGGGDDGSGNPVELPDTGSGSAISASSSVSTFALIAALVLLALSTGTSIWLFRRSRAI